MELTVQLVTRNNRQTITKAIESLKPLNAQIVVGDVGSGDGTPDICRRLGCQVSHFEPETGHDYIRNTLAERSRTDWQMYLNPWETLIQGHQHVVTSKSNCRKATVIQDSIVSQEARMWRRSSKLIFRNPVYEFLDAEGDRSPVCIYSNSGQDYNYNLSMTAAWKSRHPTSREPHYYHALTLLALQNYDAFLNASEHYMFMDPKPTKSSILNRYYYSVVQLVHRRKARPAFQNLNLCIAAQPLMAEFWCLTGDIYYHLYNKFTAAKEFYENAMLLGSRRLADDGWPMDVSKYDEYPKRMIASCEEILGKNAIYLA